MFLDIGNARVPKIINSTKNGTEKNFASQWLSISPNSMIRITVGRLSEFNSSPCFFIIIIEKARRLRYCKTLLELS